MGVNCLPLFLANWSSCGKGSTPGARIKISGVVLVMRLGSWSNDCQLTVSFLTNRSSPSFSFTKIIVANLTRSGRIALMRIIRCSLLQFFSHSAGNRSDSGVALLYHRRNSLELCTKAPTIPLKFGISCIEQIMSHDWSVIHSGFGFVVAFFFSKLVLPRRKKLYSSMSIPSSSSSSITTFAGIADCFFSSSCLVGIFFSLIFDNFTASCNPSKSLSFSNSPREAYR